MKKYGMIALVAFIAAFGYYYFGNQNKPQEVKEVAKVETTEKKVELTDPKTGEATDAGANRTNAEKEAALEADKKETTDEQKKDDKNTSDIKALYTKLGLEDKLDYKIFNMAITGMRKINPKKKSHIMIVDFTKPSSEKRFFLLDLENEKIVYHDLVAHGKNTGGKTSDSFSNVNNSKKSSLGFYVTKEPYFGSNGYSLRMEGLDKGMNDNAMKRAIVVHGSSYVSDDFVKNVGRIGRSWGCPAVKKSIAKDLIDTIKHGAVVFHYAKEYDGKSTVLKGEKF